MFHESYYDHSCLIANEQDVLYTDIKGDGFMQKFTRWWHDLYLLSYSDERCRMYYTSSQAMRLERTRHFRKHRNRIHPLSKFSNFWTLFMLLITWTERVLLHHNTNVIFGQLPLMFYYVGVVLEVFIILDLFVSFKTGYIDVEARQIILNKTKGHVHFASTKLFVHAAGAVPLHVMLFLRYGAVPDCGRCKSNRFVCCLKVVNIFGLIRFYNATSYLARPRKSYMVTCFLRFLRIVLIGFTTMLQCLNLNDTVNIWVMLETDEIRNDSFLEMILHVRYGTAKRLPHLLFLSKELSMISKSLLGYDTGMKEKVFYLDIVSGMFECIVASIFYAWSLAECYAVIFRVKYAEDQVMSQKEKTLNLLRCRRLSDRISRRVHSYFDFNMSKLRLFENQNDLYQFLPSSLHREMRRACYLRYLKRVTEFKEWPLVVLEELAMLIKDEIFMELDIVADVRWWIPLVLILYCFHILSCADEAWKAGEGLTILYVGVLAVYNTKNEEVGHLIDGDYFGELSLITDKEIRTSYVVATTMCKILFLPKISFRRFMRNCPQLFFEMRDRVQVKHKDPGGASMSADNTPDHSISPATTTHSPYQSYFSMGDKQNEPA